MRFARLTTVGLFAMVLSLPAALQAADQIPWVTNFQVAQQTARDQDKLILVHFSSDNCPPCRRLEQVVFSKSTFAHKISSLYVPVHVNVTASPDLARHFRVDRWPTDLILTHEGEEITRMVSPQNEGEYTNTLEQIVWRYRSRPAGAQPQIAAGTSTNSASHSIYATEANRQIYNAAAAGARLASAEQLESGGVVPPSVESPFSRAARFEVGPATPGAGFEPPAATVPNHPQPQMVHNQFIQPQAEAASENSVAPLSSVQPDETQPAQRVTALDLQPPQEQTPIARQDQPVAGEVASQTVERDTATSPPRSPKESTDAVQISEADNSIDGKLAPTQRKTADPQVGLDGYCPVTLAEQFQWARGDSRWGVRHRGRTYLFHSAAAQQKFLREPDRYSPALTGYDPVVFAERSEYVDGMRAHGVMYKKQIFLFADEQSLSRFWQDPDRFASVVHQAMGTTETQFR